MKFKLGDKMVGLVRTVNLEEVAAVGPMFHGVETQIATKTELVIRCDDDDIPLHFKFARDNYVYEFGGMCSFTKVLSPLTLSAIEVHCGKVSHIQALTVIDHHLRANNIAHEVIIGDTINIAMDYCRRCNVKSKVYDEIECAAGACSDGSYIDLEPGDMHDTILKCFEKEATRLREEAAWWADLARIATEEANRQLHE